MGTRLTPSLARTRTPRPGTLDAAARDGCGTCVERGQRQLLAARRAWASAKSELTAGTGSETGRPTLRALLALAPYVLRELCRAMGALSACIFGKA